MSTHVVLIVKNEAKVIERCLESCRRIGIKRAFVCDTGSTDDTVEVARAYGCIEHTVDPDKDLSVTIARLEWKGFGETRTESIKLARQDPRTRPDDYLLLLDADQTVFGTLPTSSPESPPVDGYLVPLISATLRWDNVKLIRASTPWRYEGRSHEYLTTDDKPHRIESYTGLEITEHADGGARPPGFQPRWEQDVIALEQDWIDKADPRTAFYLGRTHDDLGNIKQALDWYLLRVDMREGYEDERFYSYFRRGVLRQSIEDLLHAWELKPGRWEPIDEACRQLRLKGLYRGSHALSTQALATPATPYGLFVHKHVYEWGLLLEHSVSAYYIGKKDECDAISKLLLTRDIPPHVRATIESNLSFTSTAYTPDAIRRGNLLCHVGKNSDSDQSTSPTQQQTYSPPVQQREESTVEQG